MNWTVFTEAEQAILRQVDYRRLTGTTPAEMVAEASAILKKRNKRKGIKALQAKYGYEGADHVVSERAGRRIHLRH